MRCKGRSILSGFNSPSSIMVVIAAVVPRYPVSTVSMLIGDTCTLPSVPSFTNLATALANSDVVDAVRM